MGYNNFKDKLFWNESDIMHGENNEISVIEKYIIDNIDSAIENKHIKIFYQPVIRTISGFLCGFEALSRWEDPERGFLNSMDFVPVLEKYDIISKLDIYVINEICRLIYEQANDNKTIVPISFNLSRLDFLECDIFNEVEKALKKYDIPRDMICIEITESVFIQNKEIITSAIDRFHNAGYKVWMDDFGSGFSSLNVLKDYYFDEFKIDMAFLSNFNLKSKQIITSTIQMAKRIGIQTLAEGVENINQFNFLRDIGCEKVQGFYFGKPMPYEQALENLNKKHIQMETREWKDYYDQVGSVDFNTDQSFALVEFDGKNRHIIFANDHFKNVIAETDLHTLQEYEVAATANDSFGNMIRDFNKNVVLSNKKRSLTFVSGRKYFRIESYNIARNHEYYMNYITLANITSDESKDETSLIEKVNKNIFYLYEVVAYISIKGDFIASMKGNIFASQDNDKSVEHYYSRYAKEAIYSQDYEKFVKFCDISTIVSRIQEEKKGHITSYFRTKDENGEIYWSEHTIILVPFSKESDYIHCVRRIDVTDNVLDALIKKLESNLIYQDYKKNDLKAKEAIIFENIMNSGKVKFFWKDKNRRFLGASATFLDFYDLKLEDIIGKTDEDMNWHVNNDPYRNVELEVINKGKTLYNVPGKCIVHGRVHNIMASKFPFYVGDNIEGLIGYFIDLDNLIDRTKTQELLLSEDEVTGATNSVGFFSTLATLNEQYRVKGERFVAIKIKIPEMRRIFQTYGLEFGKELLKEISNRLFHIVGVTGEICRLSESMFVVLYKYSEDLKVTNLIDDIQNAIDSIHKLNRKDVTLHGDLKTLDVQETNAFDDFISRILLL